MKGYHVRPVGRRRPTASYTCLKEVHFVRRPHRNRRKFDDKILIDALAEVCERLFPEYAEFVTYRKQSWDDLTFKTVDDNVAQRLRERREQRSLFKEVAIPTENNPVE